MTRLGLIVEGQTEVGALTVLVRRLAEESDRVVVAERPFRVKRTQIVRPGEVERSVSRLVQTRAADGILLLVDADDDPWETLEQRLQERGQVTSPVPFFAVTAQPTFESWFLAAKPSLRGVRGIRAVADVPAEGPEGVRNGAARLTANMDGNRRYLKTDDAPAFAAHMDLAMAREHSASFRRFCVAFDELTVG